MRERSNVMTIAKRVRVTDEHVRYYQENGFVQVDDVLTPEELVELRTSLDESMNAKSMYALQTDKTGGAYYKVLNQKVNTWRDHGIMARYVLSEQFAGMAKRLTGASGIRLFHDHALLKMPGDSKPTPWHQDAVYWPMHRDEGPGPLSIWIALDDVDEKNGCMMFIPKSQRIKNLKNVDLVNPHDIFTDDNATDVDRNTAVICRMKAGSCTFHDGMTFHYAHANNTDKPRRALAIIYMPDGMTFSGSDHVCTKDAILQPGDPLTGGLFPKLA